MNDEMQPTKPFSNGQIAQPTNDGPWIRQAQTIVVLVLSDGQKIQVMSELIEISDAQSMELAFKRDTMAPQASLLEISISHVLSRMPEKPWYAAKALEGLKGRFDEISKIRGVIERAKQRKTEGGEQLADWLEKLLVAWKA